MRAFLALLMALLIGNPVCCCAVPLSGTDASPGPAESLRPCCRERAADLAESGDPLPASPAPTPCPCVKKLNLLQLEKRGQMAAFVTDDLPVAGDPVAVPAWPGSVREYFGPVLPPPGYRPVESPPAWIRFGVFRC